MLILRVVLLVVAVGLLGLYFAGDRIQLPVTKQAQAWLHQTFAQVKWPSRAQLPNQLQISNQPAVIDQAQELVNQTQLVLDSAIKPSTNSASVATQTFDYGRYLYCKEVVKEWEKAQ